jgi:hypothetical protein
MTAADAGDVRRFTIGGTAALAIAAALALGAGAAVGAFNAPPQAVAVAGAMLLLVVVFANPAAGVWIWMIAAPLIVGIARGGGLGVLRPNEAMLLVIAAGVGLNCSWRLWRGERIVPEIGPIDVTVLGLALAGSLVPLLFRYGRGLVVSQDDVLYAMVFVKYFVLYAVVRLAIRTPAEVATALRLAIAAGALVAVVALLQVRDVLNVPGLLAAYYDSPFEGSSGPSVGRGTSTIASSFGLADMMAMCLAIVIAWMAAGGKPRIVLVAAAVLFLGGSVAAGSFSGIIGLVVATVAVGFTVRRLVLIAAVALPAAALSTVAFWPVIAGRLEGFESRLALPRSWLGRLENLQRFFWPELFSAANWLTGVRPAARVPAPETWRDWVYIESGYTWLLWSGGVALLIAFAAFATVAAARLFRVAREGGGPCNVAAAAGFAALVMIGVLMLLDPHLTVRGSADLFFPLIALAVVTPVTPAVPSVPAPAGRSKPVSGPRRVTRLN